MKLFQITISLEHDVAGNPAWLEHNCGFYTIFNFLECLIFLIHTLQGGTKRMDSPIFKSGDYNFNLIASIW